MDYTKLFEQTYKESEDINPIENIKNTIINFNAFCKTEPFAIIKNDSDEDAFLHQVPANLEDAKAWIEKMWDVYNKIQELSDKINEAFRKITNPDSLNEKDCDEYYNLLDSRPNWWVRRLERLLGTTAGNLEYIVWLRIKDQKEELARQEKRRRYGTYNDDEDRGCGYAADDTNSRYYMGNYNESKEIKKLFEEIYRESH